MLFSSACGAEPGAAPDGVGELYDMVQSMVPDIERISGLPAVAEVQVGRETQSEVRAYVERHLEEEFAVGDLEGIAGTYRLLGLLPAELDLRGLLLDLYAEQIVGYYDPARQRLLVVEGVGAEEYRPVVAHELVHALQDQHADLDTLIARVRGNDRQMAAQAALEGHATLVMFTMLAEEALGGPVDATTLPNPGAQLRAALDAPGPEFPVFRSAPRILRESLLFPYAAGTDFVQGLWREAGSVVVPLDGMLPQSTEQVLSAPADFLTARDEPEEVRYDGIEPVYENTLGQFETEVFLQVHLGDAAIGGASGWDGDRLALLNTDAGGVLLWHSVWDDEAAAVRFARLVTDVLGTAGMVGSVARAPVGGRPGVRVTLAQSAAALALAPQPEVRLQAR